MKKALIFIVIINILFSACDCSYQYGVYAKNATSQDIIVTYKSNRDIRSNLEQVITIPAGEQKRIIFTKDIKVPEGCTGTTSTHAPLVAEYIFAVNGDGLKSKLQWLDPSIEFFKEDIQQGTFTMVFEEDDFSPNK